MTNDKVKPVLDRVGNWKEYIEQKNDLEEEKEMGYHGNNGRPLGSEAFTKKLENKLGRKLGRQKPGPKGNN